MKPIDTSEASASSYAAFEKLRTFSGSESFSALIEYLESRCAYMQSISLHVEDETRDAISIEYQLLSSLIAALTANKGAPGGRVL